LRVAPLGPPRRVRDRTGAGSARNRAPARPDRGPVLGGRWHDIACDAPAHYVGIQYPKRQPAARHGRGRCTARSRVGPLPYRIPTLRWISPPAEPGTEVPNGRPMTDARVLIVDDERN